MGAWLDLARIVAGLNVVLLLALGYVWGRNYGRFRSKHTLGLLVFALLMLAENGMAFYFLALDPHLSLWFEREMAGPPERAMMLLRGLTFAALVFLVWVTWD